MDQNIMVKMFGFLKDRKGEPIPMQMRYMVGGLSNLSEKEMRLSKTFEFVLYYMDNPEDAEVLVKYDNNNNSSRIINLLHYIGVTNSHKFGEVLDRNEYVVENKAVVVSLFRSILGALRGYKSDIKRDSIIKLLDKITNKEKFVDRHYDMVPILFQQLRDENGKINKSNPVTQAVIACLDKYIKVFGVDVLNEGIRRTVENFNEISLDLFTDQVNFLFDRYDFKCSKAILLKCITRERYGYFVTLLGDSISYELYFELKEIINNRMSKGSIVALEYMLKYLEEIDKFN